MKKLLGILVLGLLFCNVGFAVELNCVLKKVEPLAETPTEGDKKMAKEEIIGSKAKVKFQIDSKILLMKDKKRGLRKFEIDEMGAKWFDSSFIKASDKGFIADTVMVALDDLIVLRNIHEGTNSTQKVVSIMIEYSCQKK